MGRLDVWTFGRSGVWAFGRLPGRFSRRLLGILPRLLPRLGNAQQLLVDAPDIVRPQLQIHQALLEVGFVRLAQRIAMLNGRRPVGTVVLQLALVLKKGLLDGCRPLWRQAQRVAQLVQGFALQWFDDAVGIHLRGLGLVTLRLLLLLRVGQRLYQQLQVVGPTGVGELGAVSEGQLSQVIGQLFGGR